MILAGDIGGTKTHLILFRVEGGQLIQIRQEIFPSQAYAGLEEVIQGFLLKSEGAIDSACFGVAGPVMDGKCKTTNLPWIVDSEKIGKVFGIQKVVLLNDLEATAYGALGLAEKEYLILNLGQTVLQGNRAVIAAGTGLGEAILFWDGLGFRTSASEGGHTDFAPRNSIEIRLLEYLLKSFDRVSYERVLSGQGLFNIYRFLRDTGHGEEPPWLSARLSGEDPAAVISDAALSRKADLCVKALEIFVSIYGAEAGNLALKSMATGGVYIGGGIAPKILDALLDGRFMKSFIDKGRYSTLMGQIPVRVILNENTALLGAARFILLTDCMVRQEGTEK
ncbi:MAG: glucokinase [Nitrospirae bacterium]|nr:glucokinase [Nitrospirota bacterium]